MTEAKNKSDWVFEFEYPRFRKSRNNGSYFETWSSWKCRYCGNGKSCAGVNPPKRKCVCRKEVKHGNTI